MRANIFFGIIGVSTAGLVACAPESLLRDDSTQDAGSGASGQGSGDGGGAASRDASGGSRDGGGSAPRDSGMAGASLDGGGGGGPTGGFAGVFALKIDVPQIWTISLLGAQPTTTSIFIRADVSEAASGLAIAAQVCDIAIAYQGNLTVVVPQTTIDAIPPVQTTATLNPVTGGLEVASAPVEVPGGWTPAGAGDALPTAAGDPRITDPDNDGNPGITFNLVSPGLITGDIYVTFRASVAFSGTITNVDRVEGVSDSNTEQAVIGATSGLAPRGLINAAPGDAAARRLTMVRMTGDNSCDAVRTQRATLFP